MKRRHPQSRKFRSWFFLATAVAALLASAVAGCQERASLPSKAQVISGAVRAHVVRVYDGDTVKLANGEKVRFIGIDTPELHENAKLDRDAQKTGLDAATIKRMGEKSYQFTRGLLAGHDVRLEFDVQQRDRYGRLLAYVYLDDGTFVNQEIIKSGYAYPMMIAPNVRHAKDFQALFQEARQNRVGLWAEH